MIAMSVLAVLVLVGLAAGAWAVWQWSSTRPPERMVVIGESTLEDGTTVAGLVAMIDPAKGASSVEAVDSGEEVAIPGTSYSRLRDALSMGGPQEIVSILSGEESGSTAWVVLDEVAWAELIDRVGGVEVVVVEETTVFTGEELFRFEKGAKKLTGAEAVALVMGADELESAGASAAVRINAAEAVARALIQDPEAANQFLVRPGVELSTSPDLIGKLLDGAR
jgi:hypothetical protein